MKKKSFIEGGIISPDISNAIAYEKHLKGLIRRMSADIAAQLVVFFNKSDTSEYFAEDSSISSQARILINKLIARYTELFDEHSKSIAEAFVNRSHKNSQAAFNISLKKMAEGLTLPVSGISDTTKEIMKASIAENVGLIKSIPQQYLLDVQGAVFRSVTQKSGTDGLFSELQKYEGVTERRAKLITLDQTRKLYSNLTAERMKRSKLDKYMWIHSGGGHKPRHLHVSYNGRVFSLSDPPIIDEKTGQRGKPGDLINCRCKMKPIIQFDK